MTMVERETRERDILVAGNEFAYVQDLTKGDIVLYAGPTKISLSNTERMIEYDGGRFVPLDATDGRTGVQPFVVASSSQYVILENPARDLAARPVRGPNSAAELLIGKQVVIPGPIAYPLWPGQLARTIDGHQLRDDQYLLVRVYDTTDESESSHIGRQFIIKGSETKFYIPRTGLEVVPDENGAYVRTAVTLLDGQYCILLRPTGEKRYCRGPQVVIPEPMEETLEINGSRVFLAHHVKRDTGLHIRVLHDFTLQQPDQIPAGNYSAGKEIFVKDQEGFFYPTENLEVIKVVKAIPLAEKEGVYVREIATGRVSTEIGPQNYLPDTTKVEVISRELPPELAVLYNMSGHDPKKAFSVYIPPTFAVLVTTKDRREVVLGPKTRILGYDEDLEILKLSTGKPKTEEHLLPACFLQVKGNKVSDILRVRTKEHVELAVTLSYRVSFVEPEDGNQERWFDVKNYVALLCEHLGSIVRAVVRSTGIEQFHLRSTEIIRSAILGEKREHEKRPGRCFAENDMSVYDVEVLDVRILDEEVNLILSDAQRVAIKYEINRRNEELRLEDTRFQENVNRQIFESRVATCDAERCLENSRQELTKLRAQLEVDIEQLRELGQAHNQAESLKIVSEARLATAQREQEIASDTLAAQVKAFQGQMSAFQPELIASLKAMAGQQFTADVTKNLSPLAILGGESVRDVLVRLLQGLPLGINPATGAQPVLDSLH
jgi:hypothetical protein